MRFAIIWLAIGALPLAGQEAKHLTVPTGTSVRPLEVTATEVARDLPYDSIIHLSGKVEIRTPVCLKAGANNAQYCAGYVVLRADEADLHEDTGQIDARGHVTVTREK
jgi:hypothetical protein